jgi:RNA polymerase sigma factor (sigma-70 family)
VTSDIHPESLIRRCTPVVLTRLLRKYGDFGECEDAVQEALIAAIQQWPRDGIPENPEGWLVRVASRRWIEAARNDSARRSREAAVTSLARSDAPLAEQSEDDTLTLMLLCAHPSLTEASQIALTLRAVGGLTTNEIAAAFLVPSSTIGQRISRAKRLLAGADFSLPDEADQEGRLRVLMRVLYLIFNEGYVASSGDRLHRVELTHEAIQLTRRLHRARPTEGEVQGLLALMLLTEARRPSRTDVDGSLVPLSLQDRSLWNGALIREGTSLVSAALKAAPLGEYQLQAAIAAIHDEATSAPATDWPQILILYEMLLAIAPSSTVRLNRIVAASMVDGPEVALQQLSALRDALFEHHRFHAVRAHLLEKTGRLEEARAEYEYAAQRTASIPERLYLSSRAGRISSQT